MTIFWITLLFALLLMLGAAQVFSNALEHLGERLNLSSGVIGSLFAAVATALPETMIPVIAIFYGSHDHAINEEIGVGAILGAPLMLITLSSCILALTLFKKRTRNGRLQPEYTGTKRDLNFFLLAFSFAAIAMYLPLTPIYYRATIGSLLVALYSYYLFLTWRASTGLVRNGHAVMPDAPFMFARFGVSASLRGIWAQCLFGLFLLIASAKLFIFSIQAVALALHLPALLLSLLLVPLATELPEKINSITWARRGQDTLALGNLTGAMVFQSTVLPALGILYTPWQPHHPVLIGIVVTLLAGLWFRCAFSTRGIALRALLVNGVLYVLYLAIVLWINYT